MIVSRALDVLIPHYNDPDGLALSLASVAAQDWGGVLRIVVADDGSTVQSRKQMRAVIEASPLQVVLLENETNRGRPYTRNVLLDAIESSHVGWLDAGDEWYANKLSRQFETLDASKNRHVIVTCNYDWRWTSSAKARAVKQVVDQDQQRAFLVGRNLRAYLWSMIGPAQAFKAVGWFDENLPRLQDLDFLIRFSLKDGMLIAPAMRDPLCVYHKSDIGRDGEEVRRCFGYIFDKHQVVYNRYGRKFTETRLFEMDLHAARFAMNNGDRTLARTYLMRAFRRKPLVMSRRALSQFLKRVRRFGAA